MRWTHALKYVCIAAAVSGEANPDKASSETLRVLDSAGETPSAAEAVDLSISFRLGLTENPRSQYGPDQRTSLHRAGIVGAQFTVVHEDHFQLGLGLERLVTSYNHRPADAIYGRVEDFQYNGWLFYLSPGVHSRLGKAQPLGFGANVDIGFLWAEEVITRDSAAGSSGTRIAAIRPKGVITYDLSSKARLQFEAGWIWAEYTDYVVSHDYFDNFYDEFSGGSSGYKDFTGPFFATMLTLPLPEAASTDQMEGNRIDGIKPTVNWGVRFGMLTKSVQTGPSRWGIDGSFGASFARGLQVTVMTQRGMEIGLGADLFSTGAEDVKDVLLDSRVNAKATFVFATIGYQGFKTPLRSVPLGLSIDIGNLWSREVIFHDRDKWSYSSSSGLDGPAARIKLTASPRFTSWLGLQMEVGWLFGRLGYQSPLTPQSDSQYPSPWTDPSLIDFSGPSLVAMFRLNAPSGKSGR